MILFLHNETVRPPGEIGASLNELTLGLKSTKRKIVEKRSSATCAIAIFLTFCLFSMSNLSENIFRHLPTFFGETNLNWHAQLHCEARLLKFNEKSQL